MAKLSTRIDTQYNTPLGYVWSQLEEYTYEDMRKAGWTDQQLIEHNKLLKVTNISFTGGNLGNNHKRFQEAWLTTNGSIFTEDQTLTQENTMTTSNTLQELTVTLLDNNPFLEDEQRIVFQKKGVVSSATNEDIKLELIATGEVMPALEKHNKGVRADVVREDILENTGREVTLKPIKKLSDPQLEWRFVATA